MSPAYILFKLVPRENGKTDKVPCDVEGRAIDAHDPANWLSQAEADTTAKLLGLGVGIIIKPPLFAIDLDNCAEGGAWAPYVEPIAAQFPGAYTEVSVSGRGLHIIGSYSGPRPLHGTRCAAIKGELYTGGRFIALGRINVTGSLDTDHTAALGALITQRFPARDDSDDNTDGWRDGPVAEWNGPTDDEVLIDRMMRSHSVRSVFGGGASFADLWLANADKLGPAFPPQTVGQSWDGSAADLALANHLAYWTGNDCDRMARLLRRSGLTRDKHNREDYMRSTVLRACADQHTWYSERPPPGSTTAATAGVPPTVPTAAAPAGAPQVPAIDYSRPRLPTDDFVSVLSDGNYLFRPTREQWPKKSVEIACGPGTPETIDNNSPVHQMIWAPGEPEYLRDRLLIEGGWVTKPGIGAYNIYREPSPCAGNASDVQPWLDHVVRVYPECAGHFVRWLAHRAQHPGVKCNHAVVMGGGSGIGKDTILEPVKVAVGPWNMTEIAPEVLFGRFNGYVKSVILRVSEVRSNEQTPHELYERTKTLIAAPPDALRVDEKNIAEHAVLNVTGVIFTTNHLTNGLFLPPEDRRHFVMWSRVSKADMQQHCVDLWNWYKRGGLANVVAYLRMVNIDDFDPKAPPPQTDAWRTIVGAGRNVDSDDFDEALEQIGRPAVVSAAQILKAMPEGSQGRVVLLNPGQRSHLKHRMADCGYARYDNPSARSGRWRIGPEKVTLYSRDDASADEIRAAIIALAGS